MPLEWLLLDEINEADAWTILGDTNQRRSDHTLADWHQVLDVIAIDPETPIRKLKRSYRSTKPILDFANRLLPREQRKLDAFQTAGPEPTVTKVRPKEIAETTLREINRLVLAYPLGRVAVISTSPANITAALRGRGWRTSFNDSQTWEKEGAEVTVAMPDDARGLEFDAVVVVEPSEFPQNLGRKGPLYTALTRANRELSVVHAGSLPDELRRR
jgi:DNA helicase IV